VPLAANDARHVVHELQHISPSIQASAAGAYASAHADHCGGGAGLARCRAVARADSCRLPELTEEDIRACLAYAAERERRLITAVARCSCRPEPQFQLCQDLATSLLTRVKCDCWSCEATIARSGNTQRRTVHARLADADFAEWLRASVRTEGDLAPRGISPPQRSEFAPWRAGLSAAFEHEHCSMPGDY